MSFPFAPQVSDLLKGAIDIHIHSAPDLIPRALNDYSLARQAQHYGMGAILIKSHFESTASRARLVADETGFPVYGGLALNHTVGGLNPDAVEYALKMGAKMIWLPTIHAAHFLENRDQVKMLSRVLGENVKGISLLDSDGRLEAEIHPILELIAQHDAVLATGHVSVKEASVTVRAAAAMGIQRIVVTHPLSTFVGYSVEDMKGILDIGAAYLEIVYNDTTRVVEHPVLPRALAEAIRVVGPQNCIMATDSGQWRNPVPVQQMGIFIQDMLLQGFSEQELRLMITVNPAHLLGL